MDLWNSWRMQAVEYNTCSLYVYKYFHTAAGCSPAQWNRLRCFCWLYLFIDAKYTQNTVKWLYVQGMENFALKSPKNIHFILLFWCFVCSFSPWRKVACTWYIHTPTVRLHDLFQSQQKMVSFHVVIKRKQHSPFYIFKPLSNTSIMSSEQHLCLTCANGHICYLFANGVWGDLVVMHHQPHQISCIVQSWVGHSGNGIVLEVQILDTGGNGWHCRQAPSITVHGYRVRGGAVALIRTGPSRAVCLQGAKILSLAVPAI